MANIPNIPITLHIADTEMTVGHVAIDANGMKTTTTVTLTPRLELYDYFAEWVAEQTHVRRGPDEADQ